jgi:CRP-like cAMP-binding protein
MSLDRDIDVLGRIPFFAGFSGEHLKLIAFSAENRSLPEKLLLFDEGQLLHSAYVVLSGLLSAERRAGGKVMRREIGPGVILGGRALILDTRAREAVRVEERAGVLQIRKVMFRRLLQEYPQIGFALRAQFARNVLGMAAELNAVAARLRPPAP